MPDNIPSRQHAVQQQVDQLEGLIQQLLDEHRQLAGLLQTKREALRACRQRDVVQLCLLEHEKVQRISELEKQRLELSGALTLALKPDATEPMRLMELAEALPEPMRGNLLVMRQQLRQIMTQVREQTHVVRQATESLLRHMQGLVKNITAISTGTPTYGNRGTMPRKPGTIRTISVTA